MVVSNIFESRDRKISAAIVSGIAIILFIILHIFSYTIPTPPLPEALLYEDAEMEFVELEDIILDQGNGGGGGSGTPVDAPLDDQYQPQTEQVLTDPNGATTHSSGNSNHTNTTNPNNNPASTTKPSTNPFGKGGSGGGPGAGSGSGIGNDVGPGKGPDKPGKGNGGNGNGSGGGAPKRTRVSEPNVSSIESDEYCKIVLNIIVDENGDIVGNPRNDAAKTSTTNSSLINQVIALTKQKLRYNKVAGAALFRTSVTLVLQAQ